MPTNDGIHIPSTLHCSRAPCLPQSLTWAASSFSLMPPTGSTRPRRVSSPAAGGVEEANVWGATSDEPTKQQGQQRDKHPATPAAAPP